MKLGAARAKAPSAWRLVDIETDKESPTFTYALTRLRGFDPPNGYFRLAGIAGCGLAKGH